jgi:hypothetical protein
VRIIDINHCVTFHDCCEFSNVLGIFVKEANLSHTPDAPLPAGLRTASHDTIRSALCVAEFVHPAP